MISSKRLRNIYVLAAFVLTVVLVVGIYAWRKHLASLPPAATAETVKYVSFEGNYIFSVPSDRGVDELSIPGVTLVYAGDSVQAKSFDDLYAAGVVAVQPITALKDNNPEAFRKYIDDVVAADLRKAFHSLSDVQQLKQGKDDAEKIFALDKNGKRLRAMYALDLSQPVLMVASSESDALKVVGSTMEDYGLSKYKTDIDQAARVTKDILNSAKNKDAAAILNESTSDLQKGLTQAKLAENLQGSTAYFDDTVAIVGGSYNGKTFIAQILFAAKDKNSKSGKGTLELHKENGAWKLFAMQLPTS